MKQGRFDYKIKVNESGVLGLKILITKHDSQAKPNIARGSDPLKPLTWYVTERAEVMIIDYKVKVKGGSESKIFNDLQKALLHGL